MLPESVAVASDIQNLCYKVFSGLEVNHSDKIGVAKRKIMTTKNVYLYEINTIVGA